MSLVLAIKNRCANRKHWIKKIHCTTNLLQLWDMLSTVEFSMKMQPKKGERNVNKTRRKYCMTGHDVAFVKSCTWVFPEGGAYCLHGWISDSKWQKERHGSLLISLVCASSYPLSSSSSYLFPTRRSQHTMLKTSLKCILTTAEGAALSEESGGV